jgi:hypothetical protein
MHSNSSSIFWVVVGLIIFEITLCGTALPTVNHQIEERIVSHVDNVSHIRMRKDTANSNAQSGGGGDKLSSQVDSNDKKWPNDDVAAGINRPKTDSSSNSHSVVLQPKVAPPPASGKDLAKDLASQSSPPRETMVIESKGPDKDFGNNLTD